MKIKLPKLAESVDADKLLSLVDHVSLSAECHHTSVKSVYLQLTGFFVNYSVYDTCII